MAKNPRRESAKNRNRAFTIVVVTIIVLILGAGLVAAVFFTTWQGKAKPDNNLQTASMVVSEEPKQNTSSLTISSAPASSSNTSSGDIELQGTPAKTVNVNDRLLVLVNNNNPLPETFKLDLVDAGENKLDRQAAEAFEQMRYAAEKDGIILWVGYGYRTEEEQDDIYIWNLNQYLGQGLSQAEAEEKADRTIQKGMFSEYTTGLSLGVNQIDDEFANTDEYKWLKDNCYKYGFIMRYPSDKVESTGIEFQPWRLRYVGKEAANEMHNQNLSLEEYIAKLKGGDSSSTTSSENNSETNSENKE